MSINLRHSARRVVGFGMVMAAVGLSLQAEAADIGGFLADQQRASAMLAAKATSDACPDLIARAAADTSSLAAYRAGLCCLQAEPPEMVAAKAWLGKSSEAGFMQAYRLLRSLLVAEAGVHSSLAHCHNLGEGQQLCHGGPPASPLFSSASK